MKELKLTSCSMIFFKPRSMPLDILLSFFFPFVHPLQLPSPHHKKKPNFWFRKIWKEEKKLNQQKKKTFLLQKVFCSSRVRVFKSEIYSANVLSTSESFRCRKARDMKCNVHKVPKHEIPWRGTLASALTRA